MSNFFTLPTLAVAALVLAGCAQPGGRHDPARAERGQGGGMGMMGGGMGGGNMGGGMMKGRMAVASLTPTQGS
ncbi:MAG: hypothetical protein Q7T78_04235, partial [Rhodoferax sp.]|nr:hypothetical protein [Rhodoferax sp.]